MVAPPPNGVDAFILIGGKPPEPPEVTGVVVFEVDSTLDLGSEPCEVTVCPKENPVPEPNVKLFDDGAGTDDAVDADVLWTPKVKPPDPVIVSNVFHRGKFCANHHFWK